MQHTLNLQVLPSEAGDDRLLRQVISSSLSISKEQLTGYRVTRRSLDARGTQPWFNLSLVVFVNEPFHAPGRTEFVFRNVSDADQSVIIIGAGPAGLFAALKLLEAGIRPVILERGKDVRARRRDLAMLNKEGEVNPESNYCYGEGGAGTYSDGKLYTRSSKRGDINRILQLFVHFGADEQILVDAHPHIGTNKLPQIITAMREAIVGHGGKFLFGKKVTDFTVNHGRIKAVHTSDGDEFPAGEVILATGHSARDIFELLHRKGILIESKPFALGVRVEHPQELIDRAQYHQSTASRDPLLPPASYSLVQQVEGKGVFSFCMCPGGIIAPAATAPGELVVNGWSPSKRNNPYANSGMVVSVDHADIPAYHQYGPLAALYFQRSVERKAFDAGGGNFVAPAQRMVDFVENKTSGSLPPNSYLPGLQPVHLNEVLPAFVHQRLREAFREFGKKMRGYYTNEAVLVATESRTSSPVRIPRHADSLAHPEISNLYPCAEGAGYAGGIVSAAMDGERVAEEIKKRLRNQPFHKML